MANKLKIFEKLGLIEKKDEGITEAEVKEKVLGSSDETVTVEASQTLEAQVDPVTMPVATVPATDSKVDMFKLEKPTPSQEVKAAEPSKEEVEKKLDAMIESYERNKLMSIEDIYRKATLIQDVKSTVFMVDVYAKALPENLPLDIKRESVINIMNASDIKVDDLLSDAYKRIDALNNVLENVVQTTEELKAKNNATIRDLEKRIEELKKTTGEREKFQETQNTMIEYEIQRIINIVDFVKPK